MRLLSALALTLVACAPDVVATPDAGPSTDAASDVALEAAAPTDVVADVPCGGACGAGAVCTLGRCVAIPDAGADVASEAAVDASADVVTTDVALVCPAGRGDCDGDRANGCEENLLADLRNCGACGHECVMRAGITLACVSGECVSACVSGLGDCDGVVSNGCETEVNTVANCGACGRACSAPHANMRCSTTGEATCVLTSCAPGYSDCDGNVANGCECDPSGTCSSRMCLHL